MFYYLKNATNLPINLKRELSLVSYGRDKSLSEAFWEDFSRCAPEIISEALNQCPPSELYHFLASAPMDHFGGLLPQIMPILSKGLPHLLPLVERYCEFKLRDPTFHPNTKLLEAIVAQGGGDDLACQLLARHVERLSQLNSTHTTNQATPKNQAPRKRRIAITAEKLSLRYVSYATSYLFWLREFVYLKDFEVFILSDDKLYDEAQSRSFFGADACFFDIRRLNDQDLLNFIKGLNIDVLFRFSTPRNVLHDKILGVPVLCFGNNLDLRGGATFTPLRSDQLYGNVRRFIRAKPLFVDPFWVHTLPAYQNHTPRTSNEIINCILSTNRSLKYSPKYLEACASLLNMDSDRRIIFKFIQVNDTQIRTWITDEFLMRGVGPEQIGFVDRSDPKAHMNFMQRPGLWLDTFPETGGITTFDALSVGKLSPVLDLGERSNTSWEIYRFFGLTPILNSNLADYIKQANELMIAPSDTQHLAHLEGWRYLSDHAGFSQMIAQFVKNDIIPY